MPLAPQHGLKWVVGIFDVEATWTAEPDMSIAKSLVQPHLPEGATYDISFFTSGAFNKLYLLSSSSHPESYIMRVSLPIDPYFKTASEVATLSYIRRHTSIPVPRVIAYDASAANDLGFEWILMTRLEGVALKALWASPKLTWEHRVQVVERVAGYVKQLQEQQFDAIGSLFLSDQQHSQPLWVQSHPNGMHFVPLQSDPHFVIGPVVTLPFLFGNRFKLSPDRGPFQTSSAWLTSLLDLQIASTNDLIINRPEECDEYDSDDTSELQNTILAAEALRLVIPTVFPPESTSSNEICVLHHDDLSLNNILIDPTTYQVTGVVDWECIYLQPKWKTRRHPQFLYGPDIDAQFYARNLKEAVPAIPPPPGLGEDDEAQAEIREYLEKMLLRRVFDGVVPADPEADLLKRIFEDKVAKVGSMWHQCLKWAERLKRDGRFRSEIVLGQNMYIWPDC